MLRIDIVLWAITLPHFILPGLPPVWELLVCARGGRGGNHAGGILRAVPATLVAMRLFKRLIRYLMLLILALLTTAAILGWMYKSNPYPVPVFSETVRVSLEQSAEQKVQEVMSSAGASATGGGGSHTQTFTSDEINAAFAKWKALDPRLVKLSTEMVDPRVAIDKNRIVLVAHFVKYGTELSVHFEPHMDAEGQLHLKVAKVAGGRMPVPRTLWENHEQVLGKWLRARVPVAAAKAKMEPSGIMNEKAGDAAMSDLLANLLAGQPADPVVAIRIEPQSSDCVFVRLSTLRVAEKSVTLTFKPLTLEEKKQQLQRLKTIR